MKKIFLAGLVIVAVAVLSVSLWLSSVLAKLPDIAALKTYRPAAAADVLDRDGRVLAQYYDRKFRVWTPIAALPGIVIQAVVIAEDDTFFDHHGINYRATWDALVHDVEKRRFARGGSTITQQMIKNVFLSREKTVARKVREYVLARRAEEILTKRRILEIYLNEVEWGQDLFGIEAASRYYFDKHAAELTAAEAALLAGMLPNPRYYNPFKRMDKARHRQEQVLFNMHQAKILSDEEYEAALNEQIILPREGTGRFELAALSGEGGRPCWQNVLEEVLLRLYGERALYRGGLTIETTLDKALQEGLHGIAAEEGRSLPREDDKVTVISEDGLIRAVICSVGNDEDVLAQVDPPGVLPPRYTVSVVTPEQIARDQIISKPCATGAPL